MSDNHDDKPITCPNPKCGGAMKFCPLCGKEFRSTDLADKLKGVVTSSSFAVLQHLQRLFMDALFGAIFVYANWYPPKISVPPYTWQALSLAAIAVAGAFALYITYTSIRGLFIADDRQSKALSGLKLVMTSLLIIGLAFSVVNSPGLDKSAGTSVMITAPRDGGTVELHQDIAGTSQNIKRGQQVWVILHPVPNGAYYPADRAVDNSVTLYANNEWTTSAYFGQENEAGIRYEILAVVANQQAQNVFQDYLYQSNASKSWAGLTTLPDGAVPYDSITVTRV
ncbi:MAG: hypothetical protein ACXV3U_04470 [Halobacteriota archaeon]